MEPDPRPDCCDLKRITATTASHALMAQKVNLERPLPEVERILHELSTSIHNNKRRVHHLAHCPPQLSGEIHIASRDAPAEKASYHDLKIAIVVLPKE
jgi:hypothetical protein